MSTSTDTFVAFVDTLSSNLDGRAPRADELAAQAYFSRSHFDRIVSAAAGETPARFRRRVLLERAAYRPNQHLTTPQRGRVVLSSGNCRTPFPCFR